MRDNLYLYEVFLCRESPKTKIKLQKNSIHLVGWICMPMIYIGMLIFFLNGDGDKAADLVQDTFLSALENKESYKGIASEKTWLFTILKNKLLDYTRKASTKYETSMDTDEKSERNEVSIFYFYNPRKNGKWNKEHEPKEWNTAEEQLLQKERSNILKKCMELLSKRWRRILADTYLEEKKAEEICKENRITSSNYWVILHRSKVQLRECVERTLKRNGGKRV